MSHRDVAHNWAHQTGKYRKSGNMFYEGDTIYSWGKHWPIARITTDNQGRDVVLVNTDRRSVSTSSHTRIVISACSHMIRVMVPDPSSSPEANARRLAAFAAGRLAKLEEMRKAGSRKGNDALQVASEARMFAANVVALSHLFDGIEPYVEQTKTDERDHAETLAWVNRFAIASLEREAKRREQRRLSEWEQFLKGRPKAKSELRAWLAGGQLPKRQPRRIWCRVKGGQLETSQGARVPVDIAKRVFALAEQARKAKRSWADPSYQVGPYRGLGITHLGTIVVGCHRIPFHTARIASRQAEAGA